ncbi:membrane protein [Tenacibaculum holothuriorum]|uniref:Membrane protein n=2 Tax=Tenacibaculum holothuriorum TaxID=1635173 RepID=A0A1Y2PB35_9FLAO|nr:membrane protein [Tenacibaculum holothuriorum]
MFTTGRIIFASFFVIAFLALMIFSYKKDAKNNKKYYQNGALYVAIGIITVIALLFLSKFLIKG